MNIKLKKEQEYYLVEVDGVVVILLTRDELHTIEDVVHDMLETDTESEMEVADS